MGFDTRVGRRLIANKYTVVESLPAATIDMHEPNELPFALDVTSAVNIEIKHPRIAVIVLMEKSARRRNGKTWYHIINHSSQKYTIETRKRVVSVL